jgi:hypothetical protein
MRNENIKLPENRSWIEEVDYIDLGNIDNNNDIEKEKYWACRVIREKGPEKMIKIHKDELMDFVNIANSTFAAF